ncbi:hypothetical protein J6590_064391 [Homalodisca vitripennis]|nr:hypothetical protein J6590_064391 [Homalodisca vitripennis]
MEQLFKRGAIFPCSTSTSGITVALCSAHDVPVREGQQFGRYTSNCYKSIPVLYNIRGTSADVMKPIHPIRSHVDKRESEIT